MRRCAPLCGRLLAGAVIFCVMGAAAYGQDGPMVLGKQERGPMLTLDPFTGALELQGIFQNSTSKGGGTNQTTTDTLLEERLTLASGGSVLSKNFLDWKGSVTVGASEEWTQSSPGASSTSFGSVTAYDLNAAVLKNSMVPTDFWARRIEGFTSRTFAALLKETIVEYGGQASYRSPAIPTTLRIYRQEVTQSSLDNVTNYQIGQNALEFNTEFSPSDQQHLTLSYQYGSVEQVNPGEIQNNFDVNRLSLAHTIAFDKEERYLLTSSVDYTNQTGTAAYSDFRLEENLLMRHTERFSTYLDYIYENLGYSTSDSNMNQASAGYSHRLFDSLTTNGRAGYSLTTGSNVPEVQQTFGSLNADYTKKVPGGRLSISAIVAFDDTVNGASGVPQQVNQEPHTFIDPFPVVLNQQNINPVSIQVFDASGIREYVEGVDYTVNATPARVELFRVVGGNIPDGGSVLVNYQVEPNAGYKSNILAYGGSVRFDFEEGMFNGLGAYVRYYRQTQELSSSQPLTIQPDNVDDVTVGADYRVWKLFFTAEYEQRASTLAPFTAARFTAQFSDRYGPQTTLSINFNQTFLEYPDESRKVSFTQLSARLDYLITRDLRFTFWGITRNDDDTVAGQTLSFEQQAELRWHVRQTDVFVQVRHTTLNSPTSDQDTFLLQAGIRRNF